MSLVRVIPLGGSGEIGKNCNVVEQDDDIVVIDVGLSFPNEEMLGVDIVIPDFTYLIENKHRLRGIFLTHAHEDHVGALPYLIKEIDCPIYGTELTLALVRSKLEEKIDTRKCDLRLIKPGEIVKAGSLSVEPIRITHSIPESCCMAVRSKHGIILFTADFKFDFTPVDGKLANISRLSELGDEGVVLLLSDSTNIDRTGWGPSESVVSDGLRVHFTQAPGRVLITTFASNIHRMQQVFTVAAETGRKVAVAGRRMEMTVDLCARLGYLQIPRGTRIPLNEVDQHEPHEIAILTTGSQGEPMSALVQMSKQEYSRMKVQPGDTVLYSARPIPGNEAAIWRTINRLFKMGAEVVYESPNPIHVSGHAYQEELKMMINLTRPFYLAPVHGEPRHQHLYKHMAISMGHAEHRIFTMIDGQPLVLDETSAHLGEPVPCGRILVDNSGNPGVTDEVLRDRYNLANEGLVIVSVVIDVEQGEPVGEPTVQSKGFFGSESALAKLPSIISDAINALSPAEIQDVDAVRHLTADIARKHLHKKAQARPIVIPTIIEV